MTNLRSLIAVFGLLLAAAQFSNAQHWVPLANQPNVNLGLGNPLLLTDGTVILHEACGPRWLRLVPDPRAGGHRLVPHPGRPPRPGTGGWPRDDGGRRVQRDQR